MKFRTIEISDPKFESQGIRYLTVKSATLKSRVDVSVFVPEELKTKENVSVIVLLHGVYGSHWAWSMKGNAHGILQEMIKNGDSKSFILAMPSDGLWGDGSGYVPHKFQNFEKWIGEELPSLIRQTIIEVDEDSSFFIAGLSMGGYGAFRIGLKYPKIYQAISGHSSITDIQQMKHFVEEDWSFWDEKNIGSIQKLFSQVELIPKFRFDCGLADELLEVNRQLHQFLLKHKIEHQYQEFSGGHEWSYWQKNIRETYRFFSRLL